MNAKQLQYVIALSQARSFSEVAEQLNISQPALSKQVIGLEQELGVRLFDRSTTPLSLTPAGEHFVREAKDLLFKEEQLKRSMDAYRDGSLGRLVIGISPFRSQYLAPDLVRKVQQMYPGIRVVLHEADSDELRKEVAEGKYDFAIVNLPVDESRLDVIPMEEDILVLAVPGELAKTLPQGEVDFKDCAKLPFVVQGATQEMGILFDKLCTQAGFRPNIVSEVKGIATSWAMVRAGVGAALLPMQFTASHRFSEDLVLLRIRNVTFIRQPAVVTRRGQYLPECAKYAISLLTAK